MEVENGFSKLSWGFFFVMIDFRLQGIDIFPDIIGYILFAIGFNILLDHSEYFKKAGTLNIVMLVLSIFSIYEKPAQAAGINFGSLIPLSILFSIVVIIIGLLSIYNLFMGIKEMAEKQGQREMYDEADKRWVQYFLLQLSGIFAFILILIPPLAMIYVFTILIITVIFTIILMGFMKRCGDSLG